jgi:hypothetical protein
MANNTTNATADKRNSLRMIVPFTVRLTTFANAEGGTSRTLRILLTRRAKDACRL